MLGEYHSEKSKTLAVILLGASVISIASAVEFLSAATNFHGAAATVVVPALMLTVFSFVALKSWKLGRRA